MQHLKSLSISHLSLLLLHTYCESKYSQVYKQLMLWNNRDGNVDGRESEVSQARVLFLELCHITHTVGRQRWCNLSLSFISAVGTGLLHFLRKSACRFQHSCYRRGFIWPNLKLPSSLFDIFMLISSSVIKESPPDGTCHLDSSRYQCLPER